MHGEQDEAPEDAKVPAVHCSLSLAPPAQECPTGHSEPAADDDDPVAQKLPAAAVHGEQEEAPKEEKLPALQG